MNVRPNRNTSEEPDYATRLCKNRASQGSTTSSSQWVQYNVNVVGCNCSQENGAVEGKAVSKPLFQNHKVFHAGKDSFYFPPSSVDRLVVLHPPFHPLPLMVQFVCTKGGQHTGQTLKPRVAENLCPLRKKVFGFCGGFDYRWSFSVRFSVPEIGNGI